MSLRRALYLLVLLVLTAGLVPAGIRLERRLGDALVERAESDLGTAPMVLEDRMASMRTVRMMHAKDYSTIPGLANALAADDDAGARLLVSAAAEAVGERPILIGRTGAGIDGPGPIPEDLVEATRRGEMPVAVRPVEAELHVLALAPVRTGDSWVGAVGGSTPFSETEAALLSGLTRSDVVILDRDRRVVASTLDAGATTDLATALDQLDPGGPKVQHLEAGARTVLAAAADVDDGRVVFVRNLAAELAVLPALRRTALISAAVSLLFALLVGALFASRLARPFTEVADAATAFAAGKPETRISPSSIREVRRLSEAFQAMRRSRAARVEALETMNAELADRQERLATLQAELVQRERLATSARLLTLLAHEIRNPVASVRNCLEVVRRKAHLEGEAKEFADMAVDELLRMHELAERMLDLHRPRDAGAESCDAARVARETALLVRAGIEGDGGTVSVVGVDEVTVAMGPDALKQVLLNLLLNAVEAAGGDSPVEVVLSKRNGTARIEILDRGPGIGDDVLPNIFDAFFTTKDAVHGVGLGLFTAEALVRSVGGTLVAGNRSDGPGARFAVELPVEG